MGVKSHPTYVYANYLRDGVGMPIAIYLSKTCKGKTPQWETQKIDFLLT